LKKRVNWGGRKKGSTDISKLAYQKRVFLPNNIATMKFVHLNKEQVAKGKKNQVRKGAYEMILEEVSLLFQIEREELNLHTIRRCMYTERSLRVSHIGQMSPIEDIEAHLVAVILQLENMKEPLSASEGLRLVRVRSTKTS
jgi:hypothetical protein